MLKESKLSKRCLTCRGSCVGLKSNFIIKDTKSGRKLYESSCSGCGRYIKYRPLSEWHFTCSNCKKGTSENCLFCGKLKPQENRYKKWCSDACCSKASYYKHHEKNKEKKRLLPKKPIPKEYSRQYQAMRKKDPHFRIIANMRSRMSSSLKRKTKNSSIYNYLGIGIEEFISYIESLFKEGMSWENYGYYSWHLDHIIPLSKFDLSKEEELYKAWNYKNLRPLWAKDNISKGGKYEEPQ